MVHDKDDSPLLYQVSIEAGIDNNCEYGNNATYGATDHELINNSAEPSSPAAAPINTHHDKKTLLNHGHPYTDVIVDTVILDSKTLDDVWERKADGGGGGEKVTYRSLIKGNEKFRWYLMSYLVTHAGE